MNEENAEEVNTNNNFMMQTIANIPPWNEFCGRRSSNESYLTWRKLRKQYNAHPRPILISIRMRTKKKHIYIRIFVSQTMAGAHSSMIEPEWLYRTKTKWNITLNRRTELRSIRAHDYCYVSLYDALKIRNEQRHGFPSTRASASASEIIFIRSPTVCSVFTHNRSNKWSNRFRWIKYSNV